MKELIKSKKFKIAIITVGSFLVALIIFAAGVNVGIHKAKFSYKFGENYERNFMDPRPGMNKPKGPMGKMEEGFRKFEGRDFRNAHGLSGTIISIADNNIVIKDQDEKENTVFASEKTIIKLGRETIGIQDLKNDMKVVVMGRPGDEGKINADLIRIFNGEEKK